MPVISIPNPWPAPPTNAPVGPGSLLATNAPGGIPIKPLPWSITATGRIGTLDGWATLADAERALAGLTDGAAGAAAIVRDGERFVGYTLEGVGLGFGRGFPTPVSLSSPLTGRGGIFWRNDALVAVVDGGFVERFS